jgi:transcriptional regulator with XRE-family HTH domain
MAKIIIKEVSYMLNIRLLREARGMSQVKLAELSGITPAYLCELETGVKDNPSKKILEKLAAALGVSVAKLLEDEEAATLDEAANQ